MKRSLITGIVGALAIFGIACSSGENRDNPTRGTIRIASDESFQTVIEALTSAYENIYPRTNFEVVYLTEQNDILSLLYDNVSLAYLTHTHTSDDNVMSL